MNYFRASASYGCFYHGKVEAWGLSRKLSSFFFFFWWGGELLGACWRDFSLPLHLWTIAPHIRLISSLARTCLPWNADIDWVLNQEMGHNESMQIWSASVLELVLHFGFAFWGSLILVSDFCFMLLMIWLKCLSVVIVFPSFFLITWYFLLFFYWKAFLYNFLLSQWAAPHIMMFSVVVHV